MKNSALKINVNDNVVIATQDIGNDGFVIAGKSRLFSALEAVAAGHKIALYGLYQRFEEQ